jgi:hypothetical protein
VGSLLSCAHSVFEALYIILIKDAYLEGAFLGLLLNNMIVNTEYSVTILKVF